MVRVPTWEPNVSNLPGGDTRTPHATAETFGAQIGRAQSALGQQITKAAGEIGATLSSQNDENDAVASKTALSNYQADVQNYDTQLHLTTPPEQQGTIPQRVAEYADTRHKEMLSSVPNRYQKHFTYGATQLRNHLSVTNNAKATVATYDYQGDRILKAASPHTAEVSNNPDYIYSAAQNLRAIADETSLPEWKKQEKLEEAAFQLIQAGVDGYGKRQDANGARDFKQRMMTELPVLLRLRGALGQPAGPQPGLMQPGNINLGTRPRVQITDENGKTSTATVRSIGIDVDGKHVVIPTISDDGKVLTDDEAKALYTKTGKHLGIFDSEKNATDYAKRLSAAQGRMLDAQFKGPPVVLSPTDRDQVIRTIIGEAQAEKPDGHEAVANTIRNRVLTGRWGRSASEVVHAPGQFEAWARPDARERMGAVKPGDQLYQDIGAIVDRVFNGQAPDNTNGATHFYSPRVQGQLGRPPPSWSKSMQLASIGTHEFYAPEGRVALDENGNVRKGPAGATQGAPTTDQLSKPMPEFFTERAAKGQKINIAQADPAFLARLGPAIQAAEQATGTPIIIRSAFRSYAEQDILHKKHLAGGPLAAPPGTSRHEFGHAVDLDDTPARAWLRANASKFGLETIRGDDPHIQMSKTQLAGPLPQMAGYVKPDKWLQFDRQLDTHIEAIETKNNHRNAIARQNLDEGLKNESVNMRLNGDAGKDAKITGEVVANLHPDDPQKLNKIEERRNIDTEYYNKTFDMASKSEDDSLRQVESLKPVPGQNSAAYRLESYEHAHRQRDRMMEMRRRDPSAAAEESQQVKEARAKAGNNAEGKAAIIEASYAVQRGWGVPEFALAPINRTQAGELGVKYLARIGNMNNADMAATLLEMKDHIEQTYGPKHAFDIFKYAIKQGANINADTAQSIAAWARKVSIGEHEAPILEEYRTQAKLQSEAAIQAIHAQRSTGFFSNWFEGEKKVKMTDPQTGKAADYAVTDLVDLATNRGKNSPNFDSKYGQGAADRIFTQLQMTALQGAPAGKNSLIPPGPSGPPAGGIPGQEMPAAPGAGAGAAAPTTPTAQPAAPPAAPPMTAAPGQAAAGGSVDMGAIAKMLPGLLSGAAPFVSQMTPPQAAAPEAAPGEAAAAPAPAAPKGYKGKTSMEETAKHLHSMARGDMSIPDYERITGRDAAADLAAFRKRPGRAEEAKKDAAAKGGFTVPSDGK